MLRWLALAVLVVAISATAAWFSLSMDAGGDTLGGVPFPSKDIGEREMSGPPPTVVLDEETTFDFGVMGQHEVGTRDFVIGNEGPGDLVLTGTQPTCSCTVGNLRSGESVTVRPGETFNVTIRWETRDFTGPYKKDAVIETNDPNRPQLLFMAQGEVRPDLVMIPDVASIDLRRITNDRPERYSFVLASPSRPETAITSLSSSRPELLSLSHQPLDEDALARLKLDAAHEVIVEVHPSNELGPFLEEIVVRTDHPKKPELRVSVGGTIVGPISVTPAVIRMRDVVSSRGAETSALLWVRGQPETHFEVTGQPDGLNVAIAPADDRAGESAEGAAGRAYRMTVEVEPGTMPGVIKEPIHLKTDHPQAGDLSVPVEIRILGEG